MYWAISLTLIGHMYGLNIEYKSPINLNQNKRYISNWKIKKGKITYMTGIEPGSVEWQASPITITPSNRYKIPCQICQLKNQDIKDEEEIINKTNQRGRAMSYKHEILSWITQT